MNVTKPSGLNRISSRNTLLGISLIIIGSLLMSAKGIFAKLLYTEAVADDVLVTIRALLSLPLFWAWAIWRTGFLNLFQIERRALLGSAVAGIICYYLGARLDFYALTLIDAGLERVLLYTYPAIVVLVTAIVVRRLPEWRVIIAVVLTYTGVVLAVGGFNAELWQANMFGAGLVTFCAITFAFYFFANEYLGKHIGSIGFTVYAMTAATIALSLHFILSHSITEVTLNTRAWGLLSFMVVFVTVVPIFMIAEGVRQIGAQRAALISTVGPPSTIILAAVFLDESMSITQLSGVIIILAGILILEIRRAQAIYVAD